MEKRSSSDAEVLKGCRRHFVNKRPELEAIFETKFLDAVCSPLEERAPTAQTLPKWLNPPRMIMTTHSWTLREEGGEWPMGE